MPCCSCMRMWNSLCQAWSKQRRKQHQSTSASLLDKRCCLRGVLKAELVCLQGSKPCLRFTLAMASLRLPAQVPLEKQHLADLYLMREVRNTSRGWEAEEAKCDDGKLGPAWASVWEGSSHVLFGHDHRRGLQVFPSFPSIRNVIGHVHYPLARTALLFCCIHASR